MLFLLVHRRVGRPVALCLISRLIGEKFRVPLLDTPYVYGSRNKHDKL